MLNRRRFVSRDTRTFLRRRCRFSRALPGWVCARSPRRWANIARMRRFRRGWGTGEAGDESQGVKLIPVIALVLGVLIGGLVVRSGLPDCSEVSRGEGRYHQVCRETLP